ncbi:G-protein coupled receptor Mth2-like isoform X2 [Aricia agestis]|uniref:G-protein coupled receptor Mth2-like isoform X2 n=1 Tax=Aricia agestis TaxID=91739 RepID=UPI001C206580|nr:G-protein coupled receptor Mth2-like isoform X2 [Aricia agestis]
MIFLFLICHLFYVSGQLCDTKDSLDLTGMQSFRDGSIVKDGIRFPPQYIFTKEVGGENRTFGCVCEIKTCFRKCCPQGTVFSRKDKECIVVRDLLEEQGFNISFLNSYQRTVSLDSDDIALLFGLPCDGDVYIETLNWYLQEDGKLYIEIPSHIPPWELRTPDKYCIDTVVSQDENGERTLKLDALTCFASEDREFYVVGPACMIISCVFILATVAVYAWLPELRNLHGRVLMAYLLCLLVGFSSLSTMQILLTVDNISSVCCIALTIIIYFSLLAAFFWLNVMSFDIWWTFSGNRGMTTEKMSIRRKFSVYTIYAFSMPTILTILLISLEFSGLPPNPFLPLLRHQGCFLYGKSRLLYLYLPMVILCVANMIFFILTAKKITEIKKETSVLKSKESATTVNQSKEKQRLLLYVKLFVIMGINWLLEVFSALYPDAVYIWHITDAYNVLIGLNIFIIFVCKKKIFYLLKKRSLSNNSIPDSIAKEC